MSEPWTRCEDELPPEGEVVETKYPHRLHRLRYIAGVWESPCGKLRVNYPPTHWRRIGKGDEKGKVSHGLVKEDTGMMISKFGELKLWKVCSDDPAVAAEILKALQGVTITIVLEPPSQPVPAATELGGADGPCSNLMENIAMLPLKDSPELQKRVREAWKGGAEPPPEAGKPEEAQ